MVSKLDRTFHPIARRFHSCSLVDIPAPPSYCVVSLPTVIGAARCWPRIVGSMSGPASATPARRRIAQPRLAFRIGVRPPRRRGVGQAPGPLPRSAETTLRVGRDPVGRPDGLPQSRGDEPAHATTASPRATLYVYASRACLHNGYKPGSARLRTRIRGIPPCLREDHPECSAAAPRSQLAAMGTGSDQL